MRRTLAVLVTTAAFLAPAAAASAAETNASCNNGKNGNYKWTGHTYNDKGHAPSDCSADTVVEVKDRDHAQPKLPVDGYEPPAAAE